MESMADGLSETVGLEQKKIDVHECECEIMDDGLFEEVGLEQKKIHVHECECEIIQTQKKNAGFRLKKKVNFLIRYFIRYILPVVIFIVPFFMSKVAYAMDPPRLPPPGLNQLVMVQEVVPQVDIRRETERYHINLARMREREVEINNIKARCDHFENIPERDRREDQQEALIRYRAILRESNLLQMTTCRLTRDAATNAGLIADDLVIEVEERIIVVNAALQYLQEHRRRPPTQPSTPSRPKRQKNS